MTQINKHHSIRHKEIQSVKSLNRYKSVIPTIYDIMTMGHGGTIEVESSAGGGTSFSFSLLLVR